MGIETAFAGIGAAASLFGVASQVAGQVGGGQDAARQAQYRAQVSQNQAVLEENNAALAEGEKGLALFNAQVDENQAILAERAGDQAMAAGGARAEARSQAGAVRLGKIKTAQAASGIDVNTGSAVDVQAGSRSLNKLDVETDMANAALENYGYRVSAENLRNRKQLDIYSGDVAQNRADVARYQANVYRQGGAFASSEAGYASTAGYLNAAGTLASNASQLPWKWLGNQVGGGSGTPDIGTGTGYTY